MREDDHGTWLRLPSLLSPCRSCRGCTMTAFGCQAGRAEADGAGCGHNAHPRIASAGYRLTELKKGSRALAGRGSPTATASRYADSLGERGAVKPADAAGANYRNAN